MAMDKIGKHGTGLLRLVRVGRCQYLAAADQC